MFAEGLPKARYRYPEYHAWRMAIARCHNPKAQAFPSYGARGISVCDRWRNSFRAFLEDMGPRPSPSHEIDRIDNSKGYEPSNCRWTFRFINDRNRRNNIWVEYRGERRLLIDLCEQFKVWPDSARWRIRHGWSVERAVETPTRRKASSRGIIIAKSDLIIGRAA